MIGCVLLEIAQGLTRMENSKKDQFYQIFPDVFVVV